MTTTPRSVDADSSTRRDDSMLQTWGRRFWRPLLVALALAGCADELPVERGGRTNAALRSDGRCPDGTSPNLEATMIGLSAAIEPDSQREASDSRCLVKPIEITVPVELPVVRGSAGKGKAKLSFRDASSGRVYDCHYRGAAKGGTPASYELVNCTAGLRGGAALASSYFGLQLDRGDASQGPTEVQITFGKASVAGSVVLGTEPAIAGAKLTIPAGSLSPYEHVSLSVLSGAEPALPLNNGIHPFDAAAFGVQLSSSERGNLAPLPSAPDGSSLELTLPYDAGALQQLGASEDDLVVLEVSEIRPWSVPVIMAVRHDIVVDRVAHSIKLTARHAAGYLSAVSGGARRIPYNNGPVMKGRVPIHLVYYGTFSAAETTIIEDFIGNLGSSNWLGILSSYGDSTASLPTTNVTLGSTFSHPSPQTTFNDNMTMGIVKDAIQRRNLPSSGDAMYFVVLGSNVSSSCASHCGYHTYGGILDDIFAPGIKYGLIQNPGNTNGTLSSGGTCTCSTGQQPNGSAAIDSLVSILAHEIAETLSDPEPLSGWAAKVGSADVENADNCAWLFGETYSVGSPAQQANARVGTRDYYLQQNWVNIGNGYGYCAARIENDDARFTDMGTTLPAPPAGQSYHPMIAGKDYIALIGYSNIGDTAWRDAGSNGEQYLLGSQSPQDNDLFGVGGRVAPSLRVEPGASHTFGFQFHAAELVEGLDYVFQWRMVREAVRWFGQSTPPLVVRLVSNAAALDASTIPATASDEPVTVSATFRNTSAAAWRGVDGYSLRLESNDLRGPSRIDLVHGESIEPGESKTFVVTLAAPHAPGSYGIRWQMQQDGVGPFGQALEASVEVRPSDHAVFEAQTVPSDMAVWSSYEVRASFRNTGTSSWGPGYHLVVTGQFGVSSVPLNETVAPGAIFEFVGNAAPYDPGHYDDLPIVAYFQLGVANPAGRRFSEAPALGVRIRKPIEVLAACDEFDVPTTMVSGTKYRVYNVIRNRGENTWSTEYGLASTPPGDDTWGISFIPLTHPLAPEESFRFEYEITAPSPGSYTYAFTMSRNGLAQSDAYVFDPCVREVYVAASANDGATYLPNEPDVSFYCSKQPMISCYVQDLLCIGRELSSPVPITMSNTGTSTWTRSAGFALAVEDAGWGVARVELDAADAIAPGQSKTFYFDPVAPSPPPGTWGNYVQLRFQMTHDGVGFFGDETPAGVQQWVGGCGG